METDNKIIETYKGVEIWECNEDVKRPVSTKEYGVPILGTMETGHKSIEDAKKYIDSVKLLGVS